MKITNQQRTVLNSHSQVLTKRERSQPLSHCHLLNFVGALNIENKCNNPNHQFLVRLAVETKTFGKGDSYPTK